MIFSIYADGELLYASGYQEEGVRVISPNAKVEVGVSGSVDFTILPEHYLYDHLEKFKTKITAKMGEKTIFYGRVLSWSDDFYNQRRVHCEGELSYLIDSVQPPRRMEMTPRAYFTAVVAEHNLQVEAAKQFTVGTINVDRADTPIMFENNSYRDTRSDIDSDLIDQFGGLLRTRNVNGVRYLDWVEDYGITTAQTIEFGENLLDLSGDLASTEMFTILLPTGDSIEGPPGYPQLPVTIESVNGGSKLLENLDAIAKFGRIVHTESFSGITDPATLKSTAQAFFNKTYRDPYKTFQVRALDLHLFDATLDMLEVGATVRLRSAPHRVDTTLTILSIEYDFENVDNTTLTIGPLIGEDARVRTGTGAVTSSGVPSISNAMGRTSGGAGGGGLGQALKYYSEGEDSAKIQARKIELIGDDISLLSGNIETHGTLISQNKDSITLQATKTTELEGSMNAQFSVQADRIQAEVTRATTAEGELSGRITVEADKITAEVTRATAADGELSGRITVTESEIDLRVTKAGVITAINVAPGTVTINAEKLNISGIVTAGGLALEGDLSATNALIANLRAGNSSFSHILSTGHATINGTLQAGRVEISGGALVASEVSGTNIYGGTIYEGGTAISNLFLGKTAKAADSNKLNGQLASYYALKSTTDGHATAITNNANAIVAHGTLIAGKSNVGHGHTKANISDFPTRTSASFVTQVLLATTSDVFMKTLTTTGYALTKATLDVTKNTYYFYT